MELGKHATQELATEPDFSHSEKPSAKDNSPHLPPSRSSPTPRSRLSHNPLGQGAEGWPLPPVTSLVFGSWVAPFFPES